MSIRKLYEEKERKLYGSSWTSEEIALGFVGDVGDLVKLVVAENGKRNIPDSRSKLEHELAACPSPTSTAKTSGKRRAHLFRAGRSEYGV